MDQIKAMEEGIKKKVTNLQTSIVVVTPSHVSDAQKQDHQATRAKTTFKTVAEVDAYIRWVFLNHPAH